MESCDDVKKAAGTIASFLAMNMGVSLSVQKDVAGNIAWTPAEIAAVLHIYMRIPGAISFSLTHSNQDANVLAVIFDTGSRKKFASFFLPNARNEKMNVFHILSQMNGAEGKTRP